MAQPSNPTTAEEVVLYSTESAIATITLDRPHRANAWTGRMETSFREAIATAETDSRVRVMVITGAGKFFCAGADSRALEMSSQAGEYKTGINAPLAAPGNPNDPAAATRLGFLRRLSKPVIAAVNGPAAGIGFVLACCADVRFVAVDAADVLAAATDYARALVRECAPSSMSATKEQLALDTERSFLESDQDSDHRLRAMVGSEEFREGVAALGEKRPPRFAGSPTI